MKWFKGWKEKRALKKAAKIMHESWREHHPNYARVRIGVGKFSVAFTHENVDLTDIGSIASMLRDSADMLEAPVSSDASLDEVMK